MKRLIPTLLASCVPFIAAAQILNSPPPIFKTGGGTSVGTIWSTSVTPTSGTAASQQTIVFKINCPGVSGSACAINAPPALATSTLVTLFGAPSSRYAIANACIGSGGGTKAWDFGTATTVTRLKCGTTNTCTSTTTNPLVMDLTTGYVPSSSAPLIIAIDLSAVTNARPFYTIKSSPNNVTPTAQNLGNYLAYNKVSVQEACTVTKQTSYSAPYSGVADTFAWLKSITVQ